MIEEIQLHPFMNIRKEWEKSFGISRYVLYIIFHLPCNDVPYSHNYSRKDHSIQLLQAKREEKSGKP